LFGFPEDTKYDDPSLSNNKVFVGKGSRLIKAFDQAASFLGPDLEPFEAQLYELGWRHVAMKAQPDFWPVVGEALMCTFEDCMIGGFTAEERRAWTIIYNFMGYHMIQGLVAHYKELDEIEKSIQKTEPAVETEEIVDPRLARSTNYRSVLKCDVKVPLSQISFTLVTTVVDSWSRVTSIPNWETVTGDLFLRYIFKLAPATMELFGFPAKTDYRDPELVHNRAFLHKGVVLIKAIDTAVSLLGPDVAPLEGVLYDLGKRHVNMMAQPEHWPVVGEALFLVFEECMEGGFSGDVRKAWTIMYNFLGFHMIEGLKFQYKLLQEGK
jgi:hemoglobin-like flavoprotein